MNEWGEKSFRAPGLPPTAKRFLKEDLGLTSMELSLNALAPGEEMPFVHRHRDNEEVYVFLSGEGEFQADESLIPVRAGTCLRCAPSVERTWRNVGGVPLVFLVIQAREGAYGASSKIGDGEFVARQPVWSAAQPNR